MMSGENESQEILDEIRLSNPIEFHTEMMWLTIAYYYDMSQDVYTSYNCKQSIREVVERITRDAQSRVKSK